MMVGEWPLRVWRTQLGPGLRRYPCAPIEDVVNTPSAPMRGLARGRCRHVRILPPIVGEQGVGVVCRCELE